MASQTTLSDDEQAEVYHGHAFALARGMAQEWTTMLGTHAPFALMAAIDAFGQALAAHLDGEAAAQFLEELAQALRNAGQGEATQ